MRLKLRFLFLFVLFGLFTGMGGRATSTRGELRPEIRLKLYNEAIGHYEKAKSFHRAGRGEEALRELHRATKVVSAFPEAYDLAYQIYLELGKEREAEEQKGFYQHFGGKEGASLYRLREAVLKEIEYRKKSAPPPDIRPLPAFFFSGLSAGIFILGMIYEYRRAIQGSDRGSERQSIILEPFPSEETEEIHVSWLFKLCALLTPAPFLFSFLVALGFHNFSELWGPFLFSGIIVTVAVYLIFFADLSGLGGFRRPGPAG